MIRRGAWRILRAVRDRIPDGWPGLVAIVVLVAGTAIVHGRPAATEPGGYLGGEFLWADERGPDLAVTTEGAEASAAAVDAALTTLGPDALEQRYVATIVASFPSQAEASEAAQRVEVPTDAVVLQQGPLVIVTPLEHDPEGPADPRIAQLADLGGTVLVEGDRYGEGAMVADLACEASSAEHAAAIGTELGDFGAQLSYAYARPPWVGPPLTDDETLARSTYRRWATTIADSVAGDPVFAELGQRYLDATSAAERAALTDELARRVREGGDDVLASDVHAGVAALLAAAPRDVDPDASTAWGLGLGRFLGPLPRSDPEAPPTWFEQRWGALVGSVQSAGTEVRIGWMMFNRFALGFHQLLAYLEDRGCADVRVRLTDFDEVRGD